MLFKVITLFLIFMGVLAMFGRLRLRKKGGPAKVLKCPECGAPRIGRGACACGAD